MIGLWNIWVYLWSVLFQSVFSGFLFGAENIIARLKVPNVNFWLEHMVWAGNGATYSKLNTATAPFPT